MRGLIEPHSFEPKEIQWAQTFVCSADVSLAPKIIAALHSVGMKSTFKNHSTVEDLFNGPLRMAVEMVFICTGPGEIDQATALAVIKEKAWKDPLIVFVTDEAEVASGCFRVSKAEAVDKAALEKLFLYYGDLAGEWNRRQPRRYDPNPTNRHKRYFDTGEDIIFY
jgi:hypothetical protein